MVLFLKKQSTGHMEKQSIQNQSNPFSCFLNSPKFLGGFLSKSMLDHHHNHHPTSIVKHSYEEKGIGLLALEVEEEKDEDLDSCSRKMVLFGANLKKIQVPEQPHKVEESEKSPSDYGIKTKNLQENSSVKSHCLREIGRISLTLSEMELTEEYTCVMKHGNDPKIIHIFDDMIVERKNLTEGKNNGNSLEVDFLGFFCCNCKVKLGDDKDIYMYRGEKSFCSPECRFQHMIMEGDEVDEKEFQIF